MLLLAPVKKACEVAISGLLAGVWADRAAATNRRMDSLMCVPQIDCTGSGAGFRRVGGWPADGNIPHPQTRLRLRERRPGAGRPGGLRDRWRRAHWWRT